MQIINLKLDHYNFYCPVSGEYITLEDEPINEDAISFRGYWFDEFWDEPTIKDQTLKAAWESYLASLKMKHADLSELDIVQTLDAFFHSIDSENYVVFKIHKREISILPDKLIYYVIDMNAA